MSRDPQADAATPLQVLQGRGDAIAREMARTAAEMRAPREQAQRFEQAWADNNQMLDGPPGMGPPADQVSMPGGAAQHHALQHPSFATVDRLYRRLPETEMFAPTVSPRSPFAFSLGAYRVPESMQLWLTDYRFAVLRLSGIDAGDFQYAEPGRFSGQLGFDLTISGKRPNNLDYQIDPQAIELESQASRQEGTRPWRGRIAQPADFDEAASSSFASVAGTGSSLLPVSDRVQGPRSGPFTIVVGETQVVELSCVVFRPLSTALAAFEGRAAGFLLHSTVGQALINRMRPR